MKSIHTITVDCPLDPGLMWMKHINNDIMLDRIKTVRKELKDLNSAGYSVKPKTIDHNIVGYIIEFYDDSTLNAYLIMKE